MTTNQQQQHARVKYLVETETTELQHDTEDECSPFFVNLRSLPYDQIQHLRQVGLLPPSVQREMVEVAVPDKARKILGRNDVEVIGEGVTLLEDEDEAEDLLTSQEEETTDEQKEESEESYQIRLLRTKHITYLTNALTQTLNPGYVSLDSSRPWMIYWTLHSLDLLNAMPDEMVLIGIVMQLDKCWTNVEVMLDRNEVLRDEILKDVLVGAGDGSGVAEEEEDSGMVQMEAGGFGGGPGQMGHCAPTYAAVLALCIIAATASSSSTQQQQQQQTQETEKEAASNESTKSASEMALNLLRQKRKPLYAFFLSLRQPIPRLDIDNSNNSSNKTQTPTMMMTSYRVHHDGEIDVRATYLILTCTRLLNLTTTHLTDQVSTYVSQCQTYEGGFGGEPHSEAHGGYTFCALATLKLLNDFDCGVDMERLRGWLVRRQMGYEGGFQGRCNKLVDGCYSFWVGSALAIWDLWYHGKRKQRKEKERSESCDSEGAGGDGVIGDWNDPIFESGICFENDVMTTTAGSSLETTAASSRQQQDDTSTSPNSEGEIGNLLFDQLLLQRYILLCAQEVNGGLRDKPSKPRDFYHTCYNLSGLSVSQHVLSAEKSSGDDDDGKKKMGEGKTGGQVVSYGDRSTNVLAKTHPVFNIRVDKVKYILEQFY